MLFRVVLSLSLWCTAWAGLARRMTAVAEPGTFDVLAATSYLVTAAMPTVYLIWDHRHLAALKQSHA